MARCPVEIFSIAEAGDGVCSRCYGDGKHLMSGLNEALRLNAISVTILTSVKHVGALERLVATRTKKSISLFTDQNLSNHRVSLPVPLNQAIMTTAPATTAPILIHLITEEYTWKAIAPQIFKAVLPIPPRSRQR